jgi:adenylate cyclase
MIHVQDNGECWLIDLGSTNGTLWNERRVSQPVRLRDRDRIEIGGTRFLFRQSEEFCGDTTFRGATEESIPGVENVPMWLLIADIEGFTPLSRRLPEETLAMVVGTWFSASKGIVEHHAGKINKYLGDGFLACWTADDNVVYKVAAAVGELKKRQTERNPPFRIVIHRGVVTRCCLTSTGEENLLGKEINFVFRMEELASALGFSVLLSEQAENNLAPASRIDTQRLDRKELKGFEGDYLFFHG